MSLPAHDYSERVKQPLLFMDVNAVCETISSYVSLPVHSHRQEEFKLLAQINEDSNRLRKIVKHERHAIEKEKKLLKPTPLNSTNAAQVTKSIKIQRKHHHTSISDKRSSKSSLVSHDLTNNLSFGDNFLYNDIKTSAKISHHSAALNHASFHGLISQLHHQFTSNEHSNVMHNSVDVDQQLRILYPSYATTPETSHLHFAAPAVGVSSNIYSTAFSDIIQSSQAVSTVDANCSHRTSNTLFASPPPALSCPIASHAVSPLETLARLLITIVPLVLPFSLAAENDSDILHSFGLPGLPSLNYGFLVGNFSPHSVTLTLPRASVGVRALCITRELTTALMLSSISLLAALMTASGFNSQADEKKWQQFCSRQISLLLNFNLWSDYIGSNSNQSKLKRSADSKLGVSNQNLTTSSLHQQREKIRTGFWNSFFKPPLLKGVAIMLQSKNLFIFHSARALFSSLLSLAEEPELKIMSETCCKMLPITRQQQHLLELQAFSASSDQGNTAGLISNASTSAGGPNSPTDAILPFRVSQEEMLLIQILTRIAMCNQTILSPKLLSPLLRLLIHLIQLH